MIFRPGIGTSCDGGYAASRSVVETPGVADGSLDEGASGERQDSRASGTSNTQVTQGLQFGQMP